MKKFIKIAIYSSIFFSLNTICRNLTDDFSTGHLILPCAKESKWANQEEPEELRSILNQSYRYLGKGRQAFAFVSDDGDYVLKVFKPYIPRPEYRFFGKSYRLSISKAPFIKSLFKKIYTQESEEQKEKDFQSYTNSFAWLKKETGLEYLHLAKTDHLHTKLKIYDKIGILRELDLDNTCFLLQRKVDLLYPKLEELIKKNELEQAQELLKSFVQLSFRYLELGIDHPTTVEKNCGCVGLQSVQFDVGRVLQRNDFSKTGPNFHEIDYCVHHMKKWLNIRSEDLSRYLDEEVHAQKNDFNKACHEITL